MDRIPTEELKPAVLPPVVAQRDSPNGQNSDRGIETDAGTAALRADTRVPMDRIPTEELKHQPRALVPARASSPNGQNSDRGIETR